MSFYSNVRGIFWLQIFSTIVTVLLIFIGFAWEWWALAVFMYYLTGCLGITITYHRYITHRSFKMPKWCEYLFSFFGAVGGTGSTIGWMAVHNSHHRFSDLPGDPHNPHTIGPKMMLSNYNYDFNLLHSKALLRDKFHVFLHQYYYLILLVWGTILLCIDYRLFLFGFIVPIFFQIWTSNISNYANHMWGYRNFKEIKDTSMNTWWVSLITWGEGWHNNHHAEPWTYTFQRKWWEFDISAYTIYLICILTGTRNSLYNSKY